jgi:hypothetical protein
LLLEALNIIFASEFGMVFPYQSSKQYIHHLQISKAMGASGLA